MNKNPAFSILLRILLTIVLLISGCSSTKSKSPQKNEVVAEDRYRLAQKFEKKIIQDYGLVEQKQFEEVLNRSLTKLSLLEFQKQQIVISAQVYLLDFYSALGFKTVGKQYLEDDIPHIQMSYTSEK